MRGSRVGTSFFVRDALTAGAYRAVYYRIVWKIRVCCTIIWSEGEETRRLF